MDRGEKSSVAVLILRHQGRAASPVESQERTKYESKPTSDKEPIRLELIERGGSSRRKNYHWRVFSGANYHDKTIIRRRVNRRSVWWRRGELNPCPKTVSTSDLHV